MARTKQTARKSTGSAPRRQLASKAQRNAVISISSDEYPSSSDDEPVSRGPVDCTDFGARKEEPTTKQAFRGGKWPFGGEGKRKDVPKPSGSACTKISELLERADSYISEYSFGGVADTLPAVPGLYVDGVGDISVPLCPEQAGKLIPKCKSSKGTTSWQLEPNQFEIKNPLWTAGLDKLTETVASRLGYTGVPLQCKLYKLLVYGEGGHFVKHQDTDKEDGMIATMVVQLPSLHEGGDLVVYRGGEVKFRHNFGKTDGTAAYLPHYAVHYADAEHALEKVTKAFRLVLIYSVCLPSTMHHLMKTVDDTLNDELLGAINSMEEGDDSFAFMLSEEYTEAIIEEMGSRALTDIDRSRLQLLQEANDVAAPDKKLQFLIAKLHHNIQFWANGDKWEVEERDESITWYALNGGEKLGHSIDSKFHLNVLNPSHETFSGLWACHGKSSFEGDRHYAKRKTTYSRFAVVAWPMAQSVGKAFSYINVNAAVRALQDQKPIDSATIRKFMEDAVNKLESMADSYSQPRLDTVSIDFCKVVCELLIGAKDPELVTFFFSNFFKRVEGKKEELIRSLVALVDNFEWSDIGQVLLASLRAVDENKPRRSFDEEVPASGLELTLRLVDSVGNGAAQHALLNAAVEQWETLDEEELCSSNFMDLLWKWAIQCHDNTIFDRVTSKFKRSSPRLLKPAIDAFSKHLDKLDASGDKFDLLASIAQARIQWMNNQLKDLGKPFSWEMPDAEFPDNTHIQAFLRGAEETMDSTGILHFKKLDHAWNYSFSHNSKNVNDSFKMTAAGSGQNAYVTIRKTREWFAKHQNDLVEYKADVEILSERFSGAPRKRPRHE